MRRIGLAVVVCLALGPSTVASPETERMSRIGLLSIASQEHVAGPLRALEEGLREIGYVERSSADA